MTPLELLKKVWGYDSFRPLQAEIINNILEGHDTLGLLPTGGGKSITFQIPGLMLPGLTLVITPLVSLMKDQVDNLRRKRISAVCLFSNMTSKELRSAENRLTAGKCKFLYIAPERLRSDVFLERLRHLKVSLLVVDEAHCISQWGYDFRPSYLEIGTLRKLLPGVSCLALTATATPQVAEDIRLRLNFGMDAKTFQGSFSRPNLQYIVRHAPEKLPQIIHILQRTKGSTIIYARSRVKTRELAEYLEHTGFSVTYYHAGLEASDKAERQQQWIDGKVRIMVATNAFGMGIDKPDVRLVIHADIPPSLEEYYQEAGRAGRDGLRSYAVLLYGERDGATLKRRITEAFPDKKIVMRIYERTCNFLNIALGEGVKRLYPFDLDKFCHTFGMQEKQVKSSLKILTASDLLTFMEETDTPPRVMIICNRNDIFNIRLSQNADTILQVLLRNYSGLFTDFVNISEQLLAGKGNMTAEDAISALIELSQMHVVHFIPRRRTPYIILPRRREELKYLHIPRSAYEERREIMKTKIKAVADYTFNDNKCRVTRMLRYFGEKDAQPCRTCDVCLANRRKKRISKSEFTDSILKYIASRSYPVSLIMLEHIFSNHETLLNDILRQLTDEGILNVDERGYYLPGNDGSDTGYGKRR